MYSHKEYLERLAKEEQENKELEVQFGKLHGLAHEAVESKNNDTFLEFVTPELIIALFRRNEDKINNVRDDFSMYRRETGFDARDDRRF